MLKSSPKKFGGEENANNGRKRLFIKIIYFLESGLKF